MTKLKPCVIWLTGLSGAGKTTIADKLKALFSEKNILPVMLDGDVIRKAIQVTGFDEESRKKHNLNVGYMASLFEQQGNVVIVSLISPYEKTRNDIRQICNRFIEVYVNTDLQTCINRDPKGLYKKAMNGEIIDFTGISAPYDEPKEPELIIQTEGVDATDCAQKIFNYYKTKVK